MQYCYSSEKRTVLPTEIFIPAGCWNKKQRIITEKMPLSCGNAKRLNVKLLQMIRRMEDMVMLSMKYETYPLILLKDYFSSIRSLEEIESFLTKKQDDAQVVYTNLDFFFQIDDYIKSHTLKVSEFMPNIYRSMKLHLQEFERIKKSPITFNCLNYDFYEDLVEFLSYYYEHKRRKVMILGLKEISLVKQSSY